MEIQLETIDYNAKNVSELKEMCKEKKITGYSNLSKKNLISKLNGTYVEQPKKQSKNKKICEPKTDNYTPEILQQLASSFINSHALTSKINQEHNLKIRHQNPPEDITENMAKFIIRKTYPNIKCDWAKCVGKNGDLITVDDKIIEVKSFTSDGPSSFGPKKIFDSIYFLDLRNWLDNNIIILWKVNLTNKSQEWKNIKMNKKQTNQDQCDEKRRPHISWDKIYLQIKDHCEQIYNGTFEDIFI